MLGQGFLREIEIVSFGVYDSCEGAGSWRYGELVIDTRLDASAIAAALPSPTMWGPVEAVASTGSTNADLAVMARAGAPGGQVLIAGEQTAGRGRLTRSWESPAGSSVALSVLLRPSQPAARWGWLSLLTGVAVTDALQELAPTGVHIGVKWPNDVLIDGRKVCGILSERVEHLSGARAVVGWGTNLTLTADQLPVPGATSLRLAGFEASTTMVVAAMLTHFERLYRIWEATGTVREQYLKRCLSIGAELTITPNGADAQAGLGVGVDDQGCLQVCIGGKVRTFAVGDVVHARLA